MLEEPVEHILSQTESDYPPISDLEHIDPIDDEKNENRTLYIQLFYHDCSKEILYIQ